MIRLMAFDLDGTILNEDSLLEPVVRDAIAEARAAGIVVIIATGRMFQSARRFAAELDLGAVPLITYNGALIKDNGDGHIYRHHPLPAAVAGPIGRYLAERDVHVNVYHDDALHVDRRDPITEQYETHIGVTATLTPNLLTAMPWEPTKMLAVAGADEVPRLAAGIRRLVGDSVDLASSCPTFLEITGCGVNKGAALAEVAVMLGINQDEVLAAGDGQNDLEMVRYAGVGVAAHGAFPEVVAAADCLAGPGAFGMADVIRQAVAGRLKRR